MSETGGESMAWWWQLAVTLGASGIVLPVAKWLGWSAVQDVKSKLSDHESRLERLGEMFITHGRDVAGLQADVRNTTEAVHRIESKLDRLIEGPR